MIAEDKKKEVLAAIEQTQDEAAFAKIEALVKEFLTPVKRKAGFLQGSVVYNDNDWDAPLPDATWAHNSPQLIILPSCDAGPLAFGYARLGLVCG